MKAALRGSFRAVVRKDGVSSHDQGEKFRASAEGGSMRVAMLHMTSSSRQTGVSAVHRTRWDSLAVAAVVLLLQPDQETPDVGDGQRFEALRAEHGHEVEADARLVLRVGRPLAMRLDDVLQRVQ